MANGPIDQTQPRQGIKGARPKEIMFNSEFGEFWLKRADAKNYVEAVLDVVYQRKAGIETPMPSPEQFSGYRPDEGRCINVDKMKNPKDVLYIFGAISEGLEREVTLPAEL